MKVKAEVRVMHPTNQRIPGVPNARIGKQKDSPIEGIALEFGLLVPRTKRIISVVVSHQVCGSLLQHPQEESYTDPKFKPFSI